MLFMFISTALLSIASASNSQKWFLMARHGECITISSLKRKIPDIGNIEDPQSLIVFMEGKGHKVMSKKLQPKVVTVSIPDKELSLIFVKSSMCKEFIDR